MDIPSGYDEETAFSEIPLFLAEDSRAYEFAPNKITVGAVKLGGWQIHALPETPDFPGNGYLIKINYDLLLAPGAPAPSWFEVFFEFTVRDVSVLDAVPRSVEQSEPSRAYALTPYLNFVPWSGAETPAGSGVPIGLPVLTPIITAAGIGGPVISWRHEAKPGAELRAGSHSGWLVLLTATRYEAVPVVASCRYQLPGARELRLSEGNRPDSFTIALPRAQEAPASRGSRPADSDRPRSSSQAAYSSQYSSPAPRAGHPRVFVSYTHDTPAHKKDVVRLCELLSDHGIAIQLDQWELPERRDWNKWMTAGILHADFVLVMASPEYRKISESDESDAPQRGAEAEYNLLVELLRLAPKTWTRKILPVILPGRAIDEVPIQLQPRNADYFSVETLTEQGVTDLVQSLTAQ